MECIYSLIWHFLHWVNHWVNLYCITNLNLRHLYVFICCAFIVPLYFLAKHSFQLDLFPRCNLSVPGHNNNNCFKIQDFNFVVIISIQFIRIIFGVYGSMHIWKQYIYINNYYELISGSQGNPQQHASGHGTAQYKDIGIGATLEIELLIEKIFMK